MRNAEMAADFMSAAFVLSVKIGSDEEIPNVGDETPSDSGMKIIIVSKATTS